MRTLEIDEVEAVSGGNIWVAIGVAITVYDGASDFIEGFKEGYANANPRQL